MIENRMLIDSEWESIEDQYTEEEEEITCDCCECKIVDFYFVVDGEKYCEECMNDEFRREV